MIKHLSLRLLVVPTALLLLAARADDRSTPPQPTTRTTRVIEGWTIRIDDRLLHPPDDALGRRALQLLEARLADIRSVVAEDRLTRLQSVTIVLDLTHGALAPMQYHPSAEWLEEHGYARELARCVHIPQAADFVNPRHNNDQPWCVLHELAHAYHDQVLGFDEPRILEAFRRFRKSGHGDSTLLINGQRRRHYALTDCKEFFAEMSEAYFGRNDFFPFNRGELLTAEPEIHTLLQTIWGPVAADPSPPSSTTRPTAPTSQPASRPAPTPARPANHDRSVIPHPKSKTP